MDTPQHIGSVAPFKHAAKEYREKGWDVVPLPEREKSSPPKGFTGRINKGHFASELDLERWFQKAPKANIAVHPGRPVTVHGVPYEAIGIDVDDYKEKNGWYVLKTLEETLGELPDTWTSSARNDCRSGIRWYLVPYGYEYRGKVAESIETVQHVHRYGVVYPSWHPETGGQYFWYAPGQVPNGRDFAHEIPRVADLALIGEKWFRYLRKEIRLDTGDLDNTINSSELIQWAKDTLAHGDRKCRLVSRAFNKHYKTITEGNDHHDPLVNAHWNLCNLGAEGHSGALIAVREIEKAWKDRIINEGNERSNWVANAECARSLIEALRKIKSQIDAGKKTLVTVDSCVAKANSKDTLTDGESDGQVRAARRMCKKYEGKLIYVPNIGWHYWDGVRWQEDILGRITMYVLATLKSLLRVHAVLEAQAEILPPGPQKDQLEARAKKLLSDIKKCQSANALEGVAKIASRYPEVAVPASELDENLYTLNLLNCTLDLKTGERKPHDPKDLITKVCNANFDPEAKCPHWTKFMADIFPDADVREFVATVMGVALVGKQLEHKMIIFHGNGRNGKGTMEEVMRYVLGGYAVSVASDLLTAREGGHTTSQTDLMGARLAVLDETDRKTKTNEALIQKLTGDGTLRARRMYRDNIEFPMTWLLLMITNHLPEITSGGIAIWDRLVVVPFTKTFDEEHRDKTLRETLKEEADGIFMWAYDAWLKYQRSGYKWTLPQAVQEANEEYKFSQDKLSMWISERCLLGTGDLFRSKSADLLKDYTDWGITQEHFEHLGRNTFMEMLRQKDFAFDKRNKVFLGLRLNPSNTESKVKGAVLP